jgi:uncharacterized SAM-binding protein YcdF (DUF218 family)
LRGRSSRSGLRRRLSNRLLVFGGLLLAAVAFLLAAGHLLIVRRPIEPDAIVALGSHEWERLPVAAALARRHPASLVILTTPDKITPYNCDDCPNRVARMRRMGVDERRIRVVQLTQHGTFGEAAACRALIQAEGLHHVLLVTSPYHTRRALAVFRQALPADVRLGVEPATETSPSHPGAWWTTPYDRWYVSYEWAATVYYAFRYRVFAFPATA